MNKDFSCLKLVAKFCLLVITLFCTQWVLDAHSHYAGLPKSAVWSYGTSTCTCPGQAKFECYLSQEEAGVQFVFFFLSPDCWVRSHGITGHTYLGYWPLLPWTHKALVPSRNRDVLKCFNSGEITSLAFIHIVKGSHFACRRSTSPLVSELRLHLSSYM